MFDHTWTKRIAAALLTALAIIAVSTPAYAASWAGAQLSVGDPTIGGASNYQASWTSGATSGVKCLKVTVTTSAGAAPTNFAWSSGGASVLTSSGVTGATYSAATVSTNVISFTNSGAGTIAGAGSFTISNVKNSTVAGSYFAKYETFGNTDCTSSALDSTTIGYVVTTPEQASVTVDPSLTFTVSGTNALCGVQAGSATDNTANGINVSMGRISSTAVGNGAQNVLLTANANGGGVVRVRGLAASGNLKNGAISFADSATTAPAPGAERFGWTSADAASWHTLDWTPTTAASFLANAATAKCVGFSASAATTTAAGTYTATVIYTAIPSY